MESNGSEYADSSDSNVTSGGAFAGEYLRVGLLDTRRVTFLFVGGDLTGLAMVTI